MRTKLLSSILVSASMIAAPVVAAPTTPSAAKLSVVRAGAPAGDSELAGGSGGIIALALVAGIIAIAVVGALADDDDGDDFPVSA